jgi:multimeric flavodoxin WrbA
MGSLTYFWQMPAKLEALIDESVTVHRKLAGKVGAAFTSPGGKARRRNRVNLDTASHAHMVVQG